MESQFIGQSGRFAILTHDHPFFHWDLLLEAGETCWTWRLVERREVRDERREPEESPRAVGNGQWAVGESEGRLQMADGGWPESAAGSPLPPGEGLGVRVAAVTDRFPSRREPANSLTAHCPLPTPLDIERIANHRLLYLDYEGPVSGNRGHVARWDWGEYRVSGETDLEITVDLRGTRSTWTISLPKALGS